MVGGHPFAAELRLVPLGECAQWLPQLARWHQREWPQDSISCREQGLRQHLQGPVPVTLVLVRACRPIGSVSLVRYQRIGGLSPSHWVANVFLLPEHRNLGFGRVLMAGVERYAGEQGVGELLLYATDRADFYRHLGWELVRRKKVGGKPAFIFRRQLGSLE